MKNGALTKKNLDLLVTIRGILVRVLDLTNTAYSIGEEVQTQYNKVVADVDVESPIKQEYQLVRVAGNLFYDACSNFVQAVERLQKTAEIEIKGDGLDENAGDVGLAHEVPEDHFAEDIAGLDDRGGGFFVRRDPRRAGGA